MLVVGGAEGKSLRGQLILQRSKEMREDWAEGHQTKRSAQGKKRSDTAAEL